MLSLNDSVKVIINDHYVGHCSTVSKYCQVFFEQLVAKNAMISSSYMRNVESIWIYSADCCFDIIVLTS